MAGKQQFCTNDASSCAKFLRLARDMCTRSDGRYVLVGDPKQFSQTVFAYSWNKCCLALDSQVYKAS